MNFHQVLVKCSNIGILPTNSGINPYLIKSSGSKFLINLQMFDLENVLHLAPKPIEVSDPLFAIILSNPEKAPPQINKIFVVSTCKKFLLRMFSSSLWWNASNSSFHYFNKAC